MKISARLKQYVRDWLNVRETFNESTITIEKLFTDRTKAFEYSLWYKGDPNELHQFYTMTDDFLGGTEFWKAQTQNKVKFRKIHTGLPSQIIDKIVDITIDDINGIEFNSVDKAGKSQWDLITKEVNFKDLLKHAVASTAVTGDGAFKISYDSELSQFPIIEFFDAQNVAYEVVRGKLIGIRFYTTQTIKDKHYRLEEYYHDHGITYTLFDHSGNDVTNPLLEEVFQIQNVLFLEPMMMAIPLTFVPDKRRAMRGRSLFEGKLQLFDSLDEIWSTWIDEIRTGRTKTYIPDMLVPRDPKTGQLLQPNSFENRFVVIGNELGENAKNMIDQKGGMNNIDNLQQSMSTVLDLCLQGLISPATLGIDLKKLDNAEAQREKEKTTLYTRNKIIRSLEDVIPKLINIVLKVDSVMRLNSGIPSDLDISVTFGEYASPDFDSIVDTVGKAYQYGVLSLEKAIEQLWGDSLSQSEIKEEITRLQLDSQLSEPSIRDEDIYG